MLVVLIAWIAAVVIGAIMLAVIGYGLIGHIRRWQRAVAQANAALRPQIDALNAATNRPGRHSVAGDNQ